MKRSTARSQPISAQLPVAAETNQVSERWNRALDTARQVAQMLREKYGATRIVIFGSLAHRLWFGPRSDIDLAVWGIPANRFYQAVATATGFSPDFEIDLVDPDDCRPALRQVIEVEGIDL